MKSEKVGKGHKRKGTDLCVAESGGEAEIVIGEIETPWSETPRRRKR